LLKDEQETRHLCLEFEGGHYWKLLLVYGDVIYYPSQTFGVLKGNGYVVHCLHYKGIEKPDQLRAVKCPGEF